MKKMSPGDKFLFIMIGVYMMLFLFNTSFVISAIEKTFMDIYNIIPIYILLFVLMFIFYFFVDYKLIKKYLGKKSGWKGWVYTSLCSMIFIGPPYIFMPLLAELYEDGVGYSLLAHFLNIRSTQLLYLGVMVQYFGIVYCIIFSLVTILFSFFSSFILGTILKSNKNMPKS